MTVSEIRRTLSHIAEPMSKTSSLVVSGWSFQPMQSNAAGLAFSQITCLGEPVTFTFEAQSHFDVSTDHAPSLKLQLRALTEGELDCMFACVLNHVEENATLYGMTAQEVRERFKSPFFKKDPFPANLRVKVAATKYWADGTLTKAPDSHTNRTWQVRVHLKSLWFAPNAWGVSCLATDLSEVKTDIICPF